MANKSKTKIKVKLPAIPFNYDKDEAMGDGGNTTVIPTKNVINVRKVTI